MAIDTREKRAAVSAVTGFSGPGVTNNATPDSEWRAEVAGGYRFGAAFPTQFFGLKTYYHDAVQDLCLVAEADAPAAMGGVIKLLKSGTVYAVYLVETSDPEASPVRVEPTTGTKAIRKKT